MQPVKSWIKRHYGYWLYKHQRSAEAGDLFRSWIAMAAQQPDFRVDEVSRNLFTYHGEDGIIAFLLGHMPDVPALFTDIGAGDCIKSNCACLAVHAGWGGSFVDANDRQLQAGRNFYSRLKHGEKKVSFTCSIVTPENVNRIIGTAGMAGETGLLSIDIDGNDYWVWKAIEVIRPRIVVIEAKVEFGMENRLVPYGHHNHHSVDTRYNGASVASLRLLGKQKGYKLVAANKQGYNLFFVQEQESLKEMTTEEVLQDPETKQSFYPASFFSKHHFEKA